MSSGGRSRRKTSAEILGELTAPGDSLFVRRIGTWSLDKLAIIHLYLPAFADACQSAGGGYYVDGLAGPGLARVKGVDGDPFFVWGSPLLALRAQPRLERAVMLELGQRKVEALRARVAEYGDRAAVYRGDVNKDLVSIVRGAVPTWAPCFCLLDPEGLELHWSTIQGLASLHGRRRKPELMILLPLRMSLLRLLTVSRPVRRPDHEAVSRVFGDDSWEAIYRARVSDEIDPGTAKELYVDLYCEKLRRLGYKSVFERPVLTYEPPGRKRRELYHLVFATDHEVGDKIMSDVFTRPYVLGVPQHSQPPLFE